MVHEGAVEGQAEFSDSVIQRLSDWGFPQPPGGIEAYAQSLNH